MIWPITQASSEVHCKICGATAIAFGECDINQGGPPGALARPALGQRLVYHRCPQCGFMFTSQLDHWQPIDFKTHIYNDQYIDVDPDYVQVRPMANAEMLLGMLVSRPDSLRLLDFGAGSGLLAQQLRDAGIDADSEDPYSEASFSNADANHIPAHLYDVVCAFEVIEHSQNPLLTLAQIRGHLKPGGCAIISTLLQPDEISAIGCNWWYCAPRNGHISLLSEQSLKLALAQAGATSWHCESQILHIAYF